MAISRVLTGVRPTHEDGQHLGHYVGALRGWLNYQSQLNTECFFLVADIQALTTHADQPQMIRESVKGVVKDWLAVGLNPNLANVNFVLQSQVKDRAELSLLLSMIAPWGELARNPTIKEELDKMKSKGSSETVGFMTYPVDQAADIYMISPPNEQGNEILVPVGADQLPHLEFAREIARRFNRAYDVNLFRPCEGRTTDVGRLSGTDGQGKMSKSQGNAIMLSDSAEIVKAKIMGMYTDPNRHRSTDPGTVENNPLFEYFDAFAPDHEEVDEYKRKYRLGQIGDVYLKQRLADIINNMLDPIRERYIENQNAPVGDYLLAGTARASEICSEVVAYAREAMYLGFPE